MRNIDNLLESYSRFGIDLSLDRVKYLLDKLGNPQNKIPIIHVAGTNGKGSVCAFLSSILQAAGYRTGRYTSPHLVDWRERICIDGNWIPVDHIYQALNAVIKQISDRCIPTQFELITCAMWWYFAQQQIDIAVIETGLGGRLDATNVCDRPLVAVITSISRDHWQRLGDSLGQIAREKAGIIKPHCPVVIGKLPPEARTPILERAQALHSRVIEISQGVDYDLPLPGEHQRLNCALAIGAVEQLQGWDIKAEHIHRGIATTQWPGRLEWTTYKGAKVLLDGAHNLGGAQALRQYIDQTLPNQALAWIMGILTTKDYAAMVNTLLRSGDWLLPVPVKGHSSVSAPEFLAAVRVPIQSYVGEGLTESLDRAVALGLPIVVCGSLYLVGEFKRESDRDFRHSL